MGIHDLEGVPDEGISNKRYRTYPHTEWEDTLNEWFDGFQDKFPEEIKCDFIEVSPRITRAHAKAFYKDHGRHTFIRFSKDYLDRAEEKRIKMTLLHEMVHLYTYQHDRYEVNDSSHVFKWLCGRVGAPINQIPVKSNGVWGEMMEPMLED